MTDSVHAHYYVTEKVKSVVWLTVAIFVLELVGGILTHSLALVSDAGHIFADVFALGLSWGALALSVLPANQKKTYGYLRAEVLAAIINGVTLLLVAMGIFVEAFMRFKQPVPVKSLEMFVIAVIGLLVNLFVFLRLKGIAEHSLNVKSAFLHVVGDMLASVGVIIGGLIMLFTKIYLVDPIISVLIGMIILRGAFLVIRESTDILLEGVPKNVELGRVDSVLRTVEGVEDLHELHVWSVSSKDVALSCHVMVKEQSTHSAQKILDQIRSKLKEEFAIQHTTIQFECRCCAAQPSECIFMENDDGAKTP
ncbi:MAG: cation diffusion facilitator family transporter [Candidatus Zixiibacteriota bacterium]